MNIEALRKQLENIMPLLMDNCNAAYSEWMSGKIGRGAYEMCMSRYDVAYLVSTDKSIDPQQAYKACASITIDLRTAINDAPDKAEMMDDWLKCYKDAGFSEMHVFFDFPIIP